MTKKIVLNSQQRTSSSYTAVLLRNCLPVHGNLFFEKLDMGLTQSAKTALWKQTKQNELQVAVLRNPYDIVVSDAVMGLFNARKEDSGAPWMEDAILNDDVYFVKRTAVYLKQMERYLDALSQTDDHHVTYRFEDTTDVVKRKLVVTDILARAGYELEDEVYDIAVELTEIGTTYAPGIVVNPINRTEDYDLIKAKIASLSESISFDTVNEKYNIALEKAIKF